MLIYGQRSYYQQVRAWGKKGDICRINLRIDKGCATGDDFPDSAIQLRAAFYSEMYRSHLAQVDILGSEDFVKGILCRDRCTQSDTSNQGQQEKKSHRCG